MQLGNISTKAAERVISGVLAKNLLLATGVAGRARLCLRSRCKNTFLRQKLSRPARAVLCAPWHSTGQTRSAGCQSALRSTPSRPLLGVAAAGSPPSIIAPDPGLVRYTGPSAPPDPLPPGGRSPKKPV